MFEKFKVFETTVAGRPLVIETGKMAQLAGGSCMGGSPLTKWAATRRNAI